MPEGRMLVPGLQRRQAGWIRRLIFLSLVARTPTAGAAQQAEAPARHIVEEALAALGGQRLWEELPAVRFETVGHEFGLEQSERPEGPWLVKYEEATTLFDYAGRRARRTSASRSVQAPDRNPFVTVAADGVAAVSFRGQMVPAPATLKREVDELRTVLPDRALLAALAAPDLRLKRDTVIQGVLHYVIAFEADSVPMRMMINQHTGLPTGIQLLRSADDVYSLTWGDGWRTYLYSLWSLEPGGYLFPRQWDVEELGWPRASVTVTAVEFAPELHPDSLRIPDQVRQMYAARSKAGGLRETTLGTQRGQPVAPVEVAPGLVCLPGLFNVTLVAQSDGVVVLEAPISSRYSEQVIEEAQRRFPMLPLKAVVSSTDAWLHLAGLREYVARGIPIYALHLNAPLLRRLANARHDRVPDLQNERQRRPELRSVKDPEVIGSGRNAIILYPVHGEGGERMLAAYFPNLRLLYASDLAQKGADGNYFWPEYLVEVVRLVERERLGVDTVFALHTSPVPWSEIVAAIDSVTANSGE